MTALMKLPDFVSSHHSALFSCLLAFILPQICHTLHYFVTLALCSFSACDTLPFLFLLCFSSQIISPLTQTSSSASKSPTFTSLCRPYDTSVILFLFIFIFLTKMKLFEKEDPLCLLEKLKLDSWVVLGFSLHKLKIDYIVNRKIMSGR